MCVCWHILQLTICIFQGLFLLRGLGDDLDSLTEEEPYVGTVPVQHLHWQHEVFPFIWVTDIQCLRCAEVLKSMGKRQRLGDFWANSLFVFLLVLPLTSLLCPGNKLIRSIGAIKKHKDMQGFQLQREHGKQGFAATNTGYGQPAKRGRYKCCGYFAWFISSEEEQKNKYPVYFESTWSMGRVCEQWRLPTPKPLQRWENANPPSPPDWVVASPAHCCLSQ